MGAASRSKESESEASGDWNDRRGASPNRSGKHLLADGAGSEIDTRILDGQPGDLDSGEIGRAEACRFGQQQRVVGAEEGSLAASGARVIAHHGGADGVDADLVAAGDENAGLDYLYPEQLISLPEIANSADLFDYTNASPEETSASNFNFKSQWE